MGGGDPFEMNLPHLIVPFKDNQNERLVDLWAQFSSNTWISDKDVAIEKSGKVVVLTQVWSSIIALFKPKSLLRAFKDMKGKQLYGQDYTYTTACKNVVKVLRVSCLLTAFSRSAGSAHPSLFNIFCVIRHKV